MHTQSAPGLRMVRSIKTQALSTGVGAMSIAACYLRLASCGSPLENAGLLVIVIADDAKDGNPCSKGCHESLVTNKGSASHHFELQPGQLRNSLLAEKE